MKTIIYYTGGPTGKKEYVWEGDLPLLTRGYLLYLKHRAATRVTDVAINLLNEEPSQTISTGLINIHD